MMLPFILVAVSCLSSVFVKSSHQRRFAFVFLSCLGPLSLFGGLRFAFGPRRSLLVSALPLSCGRFAGNSVCLSSLLLSNYCWATLRFIVGSTFIGSYVVFMAISWILLAVSFCERIIAFEGWHSLSSSFAASLTTTIYLLAWCFSRSSVGMVLLSVFWLSPLACLDSLLSVNQYLLSTFSCLIRFSELAPLN